MGTGSRRSLTGRAVLALALMVGFYVLALVIVAALVGVIVAEFSAERFSYALTAAAVIGIYAIVSGVIPRRRKFVPPGPRLTPEGQPRLMAEIHSVADATQSSMPSEVYLDADVNAAVAHVGGFAGIGARPIMIVGLPLIAVLTRSELRGVIAHEFGHYVGGETRLAPVIYRTREAIFRTVVTLVNSGREFLHRPFLWYGRMYLRLTQSISRRQELDADALAARIAGGDAMEAGLVKVHTASMALEPYLDHEVGPVLSVGFRPPMVEGFERYLQSGAIAAQLEDAKQKELAAGASDRYDSHPSLRERIEALRGAPHTPPAVPDPPAIDLLDDVPGLETALLSMLTGKDVASYRAVAWDEDVARVWIGLWTETCREQRAALEGITPGSLPAVAADVTPYLYRIQAPGARRRTTEIFKVVVGSALTVALARHGWSIDAAPGEEVAARRGDAAIQTFDVLPNLISHELSNEDWERTCRENGIADLDLAQAADGSPEPEPAGAGY